LVKVGLNLFLYTHFFSVGTATTPANRHAHHRQCIVVSVLDEFTAVATPAMYGIDAALTHALDVGVDALAAGLVRAFRLVTDQVGGID